MSEVSTVGSQHRSDELDIIGVDDAAVSSRGFFDRSFLSHSKVKTDTLRDNLQALLDKLDGVLKSLPGEIGAYSLSEMTLAVTVTAKGSVSLLGSGGELTGQGGITLKLTRKP